MPEYMRHWLRAGLVAAIASATVACTADGGTLPPGRSAGPSATSAATVYDPPHVFGAQKIVLGRAGRGFFYLDEGFVYLLHPGRDTASPAEVAVHDIERGAVVATRRLDGVSSEASQILMAKVAGGLELFTAYLHTERGTGTAIDKYFLRVRRYSLSDGSLRWSTDVPTTDIGSLRHIQVVAANDEHLVISARERESPGAEISRNSTAIVLSSRTGELRWIRPRFIPYALAGDVIAGTTPKPDRTEDPNKVEALNALAGSTVWTFRDADISRSDPFGFPVGASLVQINTHNQGLFGKGIATAYLVDIATGRTVLKLDRKDDTIGLAFRCRHDGDSLIVCSTDRFVASPSIMGFDAASYRQLWALDETTPDRKVPGVVAVRRGVVYLSIPTTLDGRTGADLDVKLKIVPEYVGPGYALVFEEAGLVLYRATG